MARRFHSGMRWMYVLAVAGALGFGSRELLASPSVAESRTCKPGTCSESCSNAGFDYGLCQSGMCQCYFHMCGDVQC
jgi:hypothetical protein